MQIQIRGLFSLLLVIAMTLSVLVGCEKEEQNPAGAISDYDSQATFHVSTLEDKSESDATSREPSNGDFVVSEKRYSYEGTDLIVLYVENQTNRHYNVTINGAYLDENGETLKAESQTFSGFASGWQNYFIFRPKIAFDRFTYTIDTDEYVPDAITSDKDGVLYVTSIELLYKNNLYWTRGLLPGEEHSIEMRDLNFDYTLVNHHANATISVEFYFLLLDSEGQIYYCSKGDTTLISDIGGCSCTPIGGEDNGKFSTPTTIKRQAVGEDETIPDNLQGAFSVIFAMKDVIDIDEMRNSNG